MLAHNYIPEEEAPKAPGRPQQICIQICKYIYIYATHTHTHINICILRGIGMGPRECQRLLCRPLHYIYIYIYIYI